MGRDHICGHFWGSESDPSCCQETTEDKEDISLLRAILLARDLSKDSVNKEYIRGQVELITEMFGVSENEKDLITRLISE